MRIYLRDTNQAVVDAWKIAFKAFPVVDISCGDIFDIKAEAIISPANSYGFMTGGIDLAYRNKFGMEVEQNLKDDILKIWLGEMPVGVGIIIPLDEKKDGYKYMISCPTMVMPDDVSKTNNAYLAFRAAMLFCIHQDIESMICPGLCTLTGRMSPTDSATQMGTAYAQILSGALAAKELVRQERMSREKFDISFAH